MTTTALSRAVAADVALTALVCAGCGYRAPAGELPYRCPQALPGDDIDHVMRRTLRPGAAVWPQGGEESPFIRYRTLFHWYQLARAAGRSDAEIVDEVERLDEAVAAVDGHGFRVTTFAHHAGLDAWVKNETGNVAGSHKARHLFGTLLALQFSGTDDPGRPLAIASCGNAALAAAVVARAAGRDLLVFVPVDADPPVVRRLTALGAKVTVCERGSSEAGDPTLTRMRESVARGAIPFTCQGNENGMAIEGGLTLGYELAAALRSQDVNLGHLVVQVGGGALASSVFQALAEARALGVIATLPRIHTVQTLGVAPLARAYRLVGDQIQRGRSATDALAMAARNRSRYMRPWLPISHSVATGILDDETYDWLAVVRGMLATGGRPLVVSEPELVAANELAKRATGINVDATGSAGLAGLLQLRRSHDVKPNEACAVLFTGVRRNGEDRHP